MVSRGRMAGCDNRPRSHRRADFTAADTHDELRARRPELFIDIAQGDWPLERKRSDGTGNLTHFLIAGMELVAGCCRSAAFEQQPAEHFY